ncbi:unnamed protein product [Didymodactylos carnosus]|uniref:adenosine deaminase n=2 Tax=Didymodactylos carnosus TaxID=1234261 RepID=A0A8S2D1C7_9BILA|nr:unnamed protein product [Didymodactylos carnosus]CAF3561695.1 unnamed protein product [Didymodactylos carnosus]
MSEQHAITNNENSDPYSSLEPQRPLPGTLLHSKHAQHRHRHHISLPEGLNTIDDFIPFICVQQNCASLAEFLDKFPFFLAIIAGDSEAIERVAYEFVEDQAIQGVLYTEARYSPHELAATNLTLEQVVEAVNKGFQRGMEEFHIEVRTLLCCIRPCPEWSMDIVSLAEKYRSAGVVGIDLAGDETSPMEPHISAFKRAAELNIHRTVHAGEVGTAETIKFALDFLHAERIGHGYAMVDDHDLYNRIHRNDVHIECCLTSSIQTNAIAKYLPKDSETEEKRIGTVDHDHTTEKNKQSSARLHSHVKTKSDHIWHPIQYFAKDNMNFSLSCDDPSVSQITIEHEYEHCMLDLRLTPAQLTQCILNAARSCFLPEEEKKILIKKLVKKYLPSGVIKYLDISTLDE